VHPDDREQFHKIYNDYIAGRLENYQAEFRQRTSQGDWKWILSLGNVVEWDSRGFPKRMLGTHTDISAQKQTEEELRKALENLRASEKLQRKQRSLAEREKSHMRALLSAMNIGILFEDNDPHIEYVNPAFLKMWDIGGQVELVGMPSRAVLEQSMGHFARTPEVSRYSYRRTLKPPGAFEQRPNPYTDLAPRKVRKETVWDGYGFEYRHISAPGGEQMIYMAERTPLLGCITDIASRSNLKHDCVLDTQ
jgi:PAS domain-containing protein